MVCETISQDVRTKFHPFHDVFMSNSREEISMSEILGRWFLSFRGKPFEKPFFAIANLSPILQIDYSSSIYRSLEFKSETALTEEFFKKIEKRKVLESVSRMLDRLILEEKFFKGIDRTKLLEAISEMFNKFSFEQIKIPDNELFKRIKGVLMLEAASGILNELTPEQMEAFEESIKRRPLFK